MTSLVRVRLRRFHRIINIKRGPNVTQGTPLRDNYLVVRVTTGRLPASGVIIFNQSSLRHIRSVRQVMNHVPDSGLTRRRIVRRTIRQLPRLLFRRRLRRSRVSTAMFMLTPRTRTQILSLLSGNIFGEIIRVRIANSLYHGTQLFPNECRVKGGERIITRVNPNIRASQVHLILHVAMRTTFVAVLISHIRVRISDQHRTKLIMRRIFSDWVLFVQVL